jgi:pilus assembly protein Flp/PilA
MIRDLFARLRADDTGATSIEYAMIAALLSVAIITAVASLGPSVRGLFVSVETGFAENGVGEAPIED